MKTAIFRDEYGDEFTIDGFEDCCTAQEAQRGYPKCKFLGWSEPTEYQKTQKNRD